MVRFQMWLVTMFASVKPMTHLMHTAWGWPIAESLHFLWLSVLIGTIRLFDLRLLGLGQRIPIAAMHRLIPWGVAGFGINAVSGLAFLLAEPDQYVYNSSFHFKVLFIATAGVNALTFYLTTYRNVTVSGAPVVAPPAAKAMAAVSLSLWIGVIIAGRVLTFYPPLSLH